MSVTLNLTLSGPTPWHARGKASFSILFFDVSVSFDVTFGTDLPPVPPQAVDVAPQLLAALRDSGSWVASLPIGADAAVVLRELAPRDDAVLAHPLATLQVRQRLVPLDRTIDRFGADVPSGARVFHIAGATIAGVAAATEPLDDLFAPAQFTALTDDEKLSRPSFERMSSGVRVGEHTIATGPPVAVDVVFEQKVVPAPGVVALAPAAVELPADVLDQLLGPAPSTVGAGTSGLAAPCVATCRRRGAEAGVLGSSPRGCWYERASLRASEPSSTVLGLIGAPSPTWSRRSGRWCTNERRPITRRRAKQQRAGRGLHVPTLGPTGPVADHPGRR